MPILSPCTIVSSGRLISGDDVADSTPARLALASVLVQYGSANFDSMSGTAAVQTLLKGLDQSGVLSHVKFICGVLAHAASTVPASEEQGENAAAEEEEEEERDGEAVAVQAVQALVLLAKNTQLGVPRVLMNTLVLGLLMRVGCFEAEAVLAEGAKSGGKKAKKGKLSEGDAALRDCVALLEQGSGEGLDAGEAAAGSKLLSMLAELGHVECVEPAVVSVTDAAGVDAHKSSSRGPVYLDEAVRLLRQFMAAGEPYGARQRRRTQSRRPQSCRAPSTAIPPVQSLRRLSLWRRRKARGAVAGVSGAQWTACGACWLGRSSTPSSPTTLTSSWWRT